MASHAGDISALTDDQLQDAQEALSAESNRRARVAYFPDQLRGVVMDARREAHTPDETIREIFEDAMNADIG